MDELTKQLTDCLKDMTKRIKRNKPALAFEDGVKKLTIGQLETIAFLCEHKKARMSDIANEAGVKLPTMTDIVDKLVKKGFLIRERDEKDRRTVWVSISPAVKKYAEKIMLEHDKFIGKILSVLTKNEKMLAIKLIKKITDKIKEGVK